MGVRLVLTGLAILAMTTACGLLGDDSSTPHVRLDHTTAAAAVPALPDTGPAAGTLTEAWHVDTPAGAAPSDTTPKVSAGLVGGQLLVARAAGLDLYDARTGKPRWHYHEQGRTLSGYAATNGMLVARTGADGEPSDRWVGLDAATGRIRWTAKDYGFAFQQAESRIVAGAGVVPEMDITGSASDEVRAIDARTGGRDHPRRTGPHRGGARAVPVRRRRP